MQLCPLNSWGNWCIGTFNPTLLRFTSISFLSFSLRQDCVWFISIDFLKLSSTELSSFDWISSFDWSNPLVRRRHFLFKSSIPCVWSWIFVKVIFKRFECAYRCWSFVMGGLLVVAKISCISKYFLVWSLSFILSNLLLSCVRTIILLKLAIIFIGTLWLLHWVLIIELCCSKEGEGFV